jgi:hypothetical protein
MPSLYDTLKKAVEEQENEVESEVMKDTQVEAVVRKHVRKIIGEMNRDDGRDDPYGEEGRVVGIDDEEVGDFTLTDDERQAIDDLDDDLDGPKDAAVFKDIADDLGFSVSGAKQAVDKATAKMAFIASEMEEEDVEIMVLTAMKDYINHLSSSGELSQADVQLMLDHPDIVRGLDGFREFLHKYIRREMRKRGYDPNKPPNARKPAPPSLGG